MKIQKLSDGTLVVPRRIEVDGMVGDGVDEFTPTHPEYRRWLAAYERELALEIKHSM